MILFGHSMGSFLTQSYIEVYGDELKAVILSGSNGNPPLGTSLGIFIAKIEMLLKGNNHKSKFMDKMLFSNYNKRIKSNRTDFDWLCADEKEVDRYVDDQLCGFICSSSFYYELLKGVKNNFKKDNLKAIPKNLPIYIFQELKIQLEIMVRVQLIYIIHTKI